MLDNDMVLSWEEVEHDLYEENGKIFGVEIDLFNNHKRYYYKEHSYIREWFFYLSDDIYEAIKEFNSML